MQKILVIAPHADDELLGVGGTIARKAAEGLEVVVAILTGPGEDEHPLYEAGSWDIIHSEARKAHKMLNVSKTIFLNLPAVTLTELPVYEINKVIADLIEKVQPDELFIPFIYDLHQDHRKLVYALNVAWRPSWIAGVNIKKIYMYETLSETHWNIQPQESGFLPNMFIDISDYLQVKLSALACYKSQIREFPDCRSLEAIEALAKWRGSLISAKAAEAFILVREID